MPVVEPHQLCEINDELVDGLGRQSEIIFTVDKIKSSLKGLP